VAAGPVADGMNKRIQQEFRALPSAAQWALQRADGFLDLKMWAQASRELAKVPGLHRDCTPYQELALRLAMEERQWLAAADAARLLQQRLPEEPAFWVQLAYTTRRAQDLPAAESILREALERFPHVAIIPYNLACYACQAGNLERAVGYLDQAFLLDDTFRELARADEDLKPLWDAL
jgi:predicted Zn-dependent protease